MFFFRYSSTLLLLQAFSWSVFSQQVYTVRSAPEENCENFTSPGTIASSQSNCSAFNPSIFSSTSAPSGGSGGTTQYQWQGSSDNATWVDILGATSATYDAPFTSSTVYYRRGAQRSVCVESYIYTSSLSITIGGCCNFTSAGSIGSNQSSCPSFNPATISGSSPSGGSGGTTQYQWQRRTTGSWTNISGATSSSYNPSTISVTTYYRRRAKRSTCTSWKVSNTVTKAVGVNCCDNYTNAGTISADEAIMCPYDPAIITGTSPSGGSGGTAQYQWQVSSNGTSWSNISGATSASYNPPTISSTKYYRRAVKRSSTGCTYIYSNVVKKEVLPGCVTTYNCENTGCKIVYGSGGTYATYSDCAAVCKKARCSYWGSNASGWTGSCVMSSGKPNNCTKDCGPYSEITFTGFGPVHPNGILSCGGSGSGMFGYYLNANVKPACNPRYGRDYRYVINSISHSGWDELRDWSAGFTVNNGPGGSASNCRQVVQMHVEWKPGNPLIPGFIGQTFTISGVFQERDRSPLTSWKTVGSFNYTGTIPDCF